MLAALDYNWGIIIGFALGLWCSLFLCIPFIMGLSNVPKDLKDLNETLKADNEWLRHRLNSIYDKGFKDGFKNGIKSEIICVSDIALKEVKNAVPATT